MKGILLLFIAYTLLIFLLGGMLVYFNEQYFFPVQKEYVFFNHTDLPFNKQVVGFYSGDGYYCVINDKRTPDEISATHIHELCHYYIHYRPEHFCDNSND